MTHYPLLPPAVDLFLVDELMADANCDIGVYMRRIQGVS